MDQREFDAGARINLLHNDLTDVSVWLQGRYPAEKYIFVVDYYHHQISIQEIAYVVILGPEQKKRRAIRAIATQALEALGWRIVPEGGGDVIDVRPDPTIELSAHERLRAISRVRTALVQSKRPSYERGA
jgi:hypothetical protein